jgi:hypothetical protein
MAPDTPITVEDPSLIDLLDEIELVPPKYMDGKQQEKWTARMNITTQLVNETLASFESMFLSSFSAKMRAVSTIENNICHV